MTSAHTGGAIAVKLPNRAPISWGHEDAPSTISWGRIGLEALNLTTPSGRQKMQAVIQKIEARNEVKVPTS